MPHFSKLEHDDTEGFDIPAAASAPKTSAPSATVPTPPVVKPTSAPNKPVATVTVTTAPVTPSLHDKTRAQIAEAVASKLEAARNAVSAWQDSLEANKHLLSPEWAARAYKRTIETSRDPQEITAAHRGLMEATSEGAKHVQFASVGIALAQMEQVRGVCRELCAEAVKLAKDMQTAAVESEKKFYAEQGLPHVPGDVSRRFAPIVRELEGMLAALSGGLNLPMPALSNAPNRETFNGFLNWFRAA